MASNVPVIIVTGFGVNCEAESKYAWELAGAQPELVHFNDLLERPSRLLDYAALMFIGGFSYGDHMTSGHVFALRTRHRMSRELARFIEQGRLILGACNGFQIMVKLGLLPGLDNDYFTQKLVVMQNDCGAFQNFWVRLRFEPESPCVFTRGSSSLTILLAHCGLLRGFVTRQAGFSASCRIPKRTSILKATRTGTLSFCGECSQSTGWA
jgi:phosphoribosylformylglycinamidine (FGAM) synthase-like amidotransferase family enzyme